MYFRSTLIVIKASVLVSFFLLLSGCFKKFEEVNDLNTNIFDREYTGEQWFEIADAYFYLNFAGVSKARAEIIIPEENVPGLQPSNIAIYATADEMDPLIIDFPRLVNGDYGAIIDLPYDGLISYCLSLSIYITETQDPINTFEDCFSL
ncbi:hypothetical protein N8987_05580 [Crocinitomix sp.]|nr:hypothetical protein [Crocinitomix sp.]